MIFEDPRSTGHHGPLKCTCRELEAGAVWPSPVSADSLGVSEATVLASNSTAFISTSRFTLRTLLVFRRRREQGVMAFRPLIAFFMRALTPGCVCISFMETTHRWG